MVNKKRIILIGPTESLLTKRGNRFPNFADVLFQEGYEILYYTSDYYHAEKRFFSAEEINEVKASCSYTLRVIPVLGYQANVSIKRVVSNFLFSMRLFIQLLSLAKKTDLILLPSRPVELIFALSIIKRIKGSKIILDIQDVWPDALDISNKVKKRVFYLYCHAFLYPSLSAYTTTLHTAPSFVNWLRRYSKKTSSHFLPLGWENSRWKEHDTHESPIVDDDQLIQLVCVAQLQFQIDIMPILLFLKDHPQYHLTVIGEDGKGERYPEVMDYINKESISNITIIGKVAREEMSSLLRGKHIGVLPMVTPSIPNKIFDYLGANLPIVVLGKNDSAQFVEQLKVGWSCAYNESAFTTLMQNISKSDLDNKRQRVNEIRHEYSRDNLHQTLLQIIAC